MTESSTTEYKKSFGKEVIISLVAFANTDGGAVIVGVDDSGKVCGLNIGSETIQQYVNQIKLSTYPQLLPKVLVEEQEGKKLLIFEIGEFPVKPVSYKNRYYRRIHNSNHTMTLEEIVDLQQQSLSVSYDAFPCSATLADLDVKLLDHFIERVNSRGRVALHDDLQNNLQKLKLVRNNKLTVAAQLLFGDPDFSIRVGRFKSEATIIDDVVIRLPLFAAVDEALIFIKKHINLTYSFDGSLERKERWQYPLEALRELVMNAVIHRDYKSPSDIIVKVFDDRVSISNPGKLYGNLRIEHLERNDYVSSIRNRLLAEMFYLTGDIERYGTGFVRIRESLLEYPELSVAVEEMGDFFKAELRLTPPVTPPVTPPMISDINLTELEMKLLLLLKDNPRISAATMAAQLDIGKDTVKEYLQRLKTKGCLVREGSPRSGRWLVLNN